MATKTPTKSSSKSRDLSSNLENLDLSSKRTPISASKSKKAPIADSWEEDASSGSDTDTNTNGPLTSSSSTFPAAPPPTPNFPISPGSTRDEQQRRFQTPQALFELDEPWNRDLSSARAPGPERRQEKTDEVAKRLIAGALGVRAPKKTEEQKAYEKAVREKEIRKKNDEKERVKREAEEKEKARGAIWED